MNPGTKTCQNCQQNFVIEPEDFKFYEKIKVPPPTWCPECRLIRRLIWRNERSLYWIKCGLCQKDTLTMHPPWNNFVIYCRECWYSDKWEPFDYGREYDWDRPFFWQWKEILAKTPQVNLWTLRNNVGSEFTNYSAENKNCYLSYSAVKCENVFYSQAVDKDKDCFDSSYLNASELCYENLDGSNNYHSIFLIRSRNCVDCGFLFNSSNCQNCFLSTNLKNGNYVFQNMQYDKETYLKKINELNLGSFRVIDKIREEFLDSVKSRAIHKFANIVKSTNSTGDNILNSKNVKDSFEVYGAEDVRYCCRVLEGAKDGYDCYGFGINELVYEGIANGFNNYRVSFNLFVDFSNEVHYSTFCTKSSSLFACIGLRNKSYCILNKQYTKEEYEKLVPRIIEHMNQMPYIDQKGRIYKYGEFFPPELSPFSYNETIAQEYFPLSKSEALAKGYSWKDPEARNYQIQITNDKLPDHIKDATDDIVGQVIECQHASGSPSETSGQTAGAVCNEQCTEAYKIIPQELAFLRKMSLPLPRLCPNCRHYQRIKQRNPLKLWHRKCQCAGLTSENKVYQNTADHIHHKSTEHCPNEFKTTYAPERPEIIYCEQCYLREVV